MATTNPTSTKSGRFLLRMPPLPPHCPSTGAARAAGLSLNEYCVRRLASAGACHGDAAALLARASAVAGNALNAIVLHGSWVRGEATAASDVDALIVVDQSVDLSRELYRLWDAEPVTWQGHPVDPHFIHPAEDDTFSGLWAEVAVDGQVLFDRYGSLDKHLLRVPPKRSRKAGSCGTSSTASPYWTEAA